VPNLIENMQKKEFNRQVDSAKLMNALRGGKG
jgi:hypothetical protein